MSTLYRAATTLMGQPARKISRPVTRIAQKALTKPYCTSSGGAHRLQHQEGRGAKGGVGHPPLATTRRKRCGVKRSA